MSAASFQLDELDLICTPANGYGWREVRDSHGLAFDNDGRLWDGRIWNKLKLATEEQERHVQDLLQKAKNGHGASKKERVDVPAAPSPPTGNGKGPALAPLPLPHWVCHKDKRPINPHTGRAGKTNDPSTWSDYETAVKAAQRWQLDGVGYVFTTDLGIVGIDLDKCIDADGQLSDMAARWVSRLNSYTEVSPSGRGLHILVRGVLLQAEKRPGVELYSTGRYFTYTGRRWPGTHLEIREGGAALADLLAELEDAPARPAPQNTAGGAGGAYGRAALEAECAAVVAAPEGARNNTLIKAALALYELANGGELVASDVTQALEAAATAAGLGAREIESTLASARHKTAGQSRNAPARPGGTPGRLPEGAAAGVDVFCYRPEDGGIVDAWQELYGNDWLFATGFERWMTWGGTHWLGDSGYTLLAQIQGLIDELNQQARAAVKAEQDGEKRRGLSAYVAATKRTRARVASVEGMARNLRFVEADRLDSVGVLNLRNGTLDLNTLNLRPHDPADWLTYCLPYDYDPRAEAPNWAAFLAGGDADRVGFLQEFAGYALTPDTKHEIAIWLYGPPGGGKSTFLAGLQAMLGQKAGALGLADIERNRFALADLPGKTLVVSAEQPGSFLASTHILNAIISGEPVTVDRKFKDAVMITPRAKVAWAMNDFPRVSDANNGIFRRVKVVNFPAVPAAQQRPELKEAIAGEGAGILNWALAGLARLQRRGRFVFPQSVVNATREFVEQNDIPGAFVAECCAVGPDYRSSSSELYTAYSNWAKDTGHRPQSSTSMAGEWQRLGFQRTRIHGKTIWIGVKLTKEIEI